MPPEPQGIFHGRGSDPQPLEQWISAEQFDRLMRALVLAGRVDQVGAFFFPSNTRPAVAGSRALVPGGSGVWVSDIMVSVEGGGTGCVEGRHGLASHPRQIQAGAGVRALAATAEAICTSGGDRSKETR